ncbi:MAG: NADH-quinone oxidoreductase subunit A [Vicinamibacteria bacterium]|jgi:NADH-quinone oxidoreductase subunit A|nr:NADH-quinone oxidoreductase subunit A [Vicinamibacteria bacterium]
MSNPSILPASIPLLLLFAVAVAFAAGTLIASYLIGRPRPNAAKGETYECGVPPVKTAWGRVPVKYALVAMIFILLDVDAAFLYPWALVLREIGWYGLVEMVVFLAILGGGFVYAWKTGAFEW